MVYIPDLFSAYIKGRELAIEKNWQDLKNYEQIEQMRNANDRQALQLLGERADFGGNRSMFRDNVDSSKRANEVAEYAQPGMVAKADMGSMLAQDQRSVYKNNRPLAQQTMNDMFGANLGKQAIAAGIQNATNSNYTPDMIADWGKRNAESAEAKSVANHITYSNAPEVAKQQVDLSNQAYGLNSMSNTLSQNRLEQQSLMQPLYNQMEEGNLNRALKNQEGFDAEQAKLTQMQQQQDYNTLLSSLSSIWNELQMNPNNEGLKRQYQMLDYRLRNHPLSQVYAPQNTNIPPTQVESNLLPTDQNLSQFQQIAMLSKAYHDNNPDKVTIPLLPPTAPPVAKAAPPVAKAAPPVAKAAPPVAHRDLQKYYEDMYGTGSLWW